MEDSSHHWLPYRWNPVHFIGRDFALTYEVKGHLEEIWVEFGDAMFTLDYKDGVAHVTIPEAQMATIPDRAPAVLAIRSGGVAFNVATGFLTAREKGDS